VSEILAHRVSGLPDGEPLLLLNGGLMSIAAWDRLISPLEASFRVVRCDFRGQLLSPGEPEPRLDAHVEDVIRLLDFLGIGQVHLAGVSLGGLVGTRLASLHPERARSLAAITTTERVTPAMWEETARMRQVAVEAAEGGDGGRVLDFLLPRTYTAQYLEAQGDALGFYRHWVAGLPAVWFRGLAAILSALEGLDLTPSLGAIRCPVLILAAEGDRTFPPEHSRALAAGMSHALGGPRLEIVPGGSHGLVVEQSERVLEILLDFLRSHGN
jgi:pimeloyl-ACP methyl ester carboxylesterase